MSGSAWVSIVAPGGGFWPARQFLDVALATTPEERRVGLSGRDTPPRGGMLFVWGADGGMLPVPPVLTTDGIWMKDTRFSLDIAFIDQSGIVSRVVYDATPYGRQVFTAPRPSAYVLEVPSPWGRRLGLAEGAAVSLVIV